MNNDIKKQPKLNNLKSLILLTDSSIGKSIKSIQGPKQVEKIESHTLKNFNPISKSQGKKLYKKSFDYVKNLNIPDEKNIILANILKSKSNENEINQQQQEKNIIINNKNNFNLNLNFNKNNIQSQIRNIGEIPQINTFRNSNKNNNNNNISNINLNSNSKSKELNINSTKNFQNNSSKKNLENNFRKTSFHIFSENLKLNRDKKNKLFYRSSNDFSKNSLENNLLKIERIDDFNKGERKKTDILLQKPNLKLFINENNKNDYLKKSSKLIPKLNLNLNNFPNNNNNVDNFILNNNNNNASNIKPQNNIINNRLNNEIFNFKSNFTNRSRYDRNKVREDKDIYAETLYKNFMSHTHTKGSEEDKNSKVREKSENNGTLTIFQSFESETNSNNEDYYNQEIKKPEFFKSPRLISFSPPVTNNNKGIFGFSSNFIDNSDAWYNKLNANNIENEKNKNDHKKTKSSLFDSYFIKENNLSNFLPKNNQFIALNKSNSFKYFSNFNNPNSNQTDYIKTFNNNNINCIRNNCNYEYNNLNDIKNKYSENLEIEEKTHEEARLNSERIKDKFKKINDVDIKFCKSDNNFYKDEYTLTYSKSKSNSKGVNKETLNHYKINKNNQLNEENPTEFETDLKKNTKEFCKNKSLKFYEIKPHTFKKLAEFNRNKIKKFLIEESKDIELIEKIEKNKNSKIS